jgi:hypothetical protein
MEVVDAKHRAGDLVREVAAELGPWLVPEGVEGFVRLAAQPPQAWAG